MTSKKIIFIFITILFVLLGIGVTCGIIGCNGGGGGSSKEKVAEPSPVTEPSPAENPTANWQTFESTELGINILHPPEYLVSQLPPSTQLDSSPQLLGLVSIERAEDLPGTFLVEIYDNPTNLSIDKWFQFFKQNSLFQGAADIVVTDSFLGGTLARIFASQAATKLGVFAAKDGRIYDLEWLSYDPGDAESLAIFTVMRETFSFR